MENNLRYLQSDVLENLTREDKKSIEISKEIAKDVKAKKLTALETIQKLGCLLTSQSFSKREVGVLILSETLHNLDLDSKSNNLNPEQLSVLSSYFSEKLKDHHQVATTALKGVLALISSSETPRESIMQLISSIFNHITCQQQQQQDRFLIYQIYETVLNKHTKVVYSMGIDFVYGVISSIDGERDPKNLMYLFDWLQTFLKTVKLGHLTEEMFEVLACYFPVDFKAPPIDKNKITRGDLATSLCQCLTCIPDFGPHGIPLALEKLDSALKIAKEDSLDILKNGCQKYETSVYYQYSVEIWAQIQKEIFNNTEVELRKKNLETLKEIIKKLSQFDAKKFEAFVNDISDTLKGNLLPDSKLFSQSSEILIDVAQASKTSSIIVTKKVAPFLENTFKITKNTGHKSVILKTFTAFVKAVIDNNNDINLGGFEEISSAPMLCLNATLDRNDDIRIEGFKSFIEIAHFLPENVRKLFFSNLHELILIPQEEVKHSFFGCLRRMSEYFPQEIEEQVLHQEKICEVNALDMYLESLVNIVNVSYFENYVVDTLLNYILDDVRSSRVAIKHLNILAKNLRVDNMLVKENFIVKLTDFLIKLDNPESLNNEFLNNVSLVLQNTIRNQENILLKEIYLSQSTKSFKNHRVYVAVLSGLIVPMRKGVFDDYEKIIFLLDCCLNGSDEFVRNISLEVLANLLNKIDNDQILAENLNKIQALCNSCSNIDTKISVITWVTKSLVTRNHSNAWHWTDKLISCLDESTNTARGFRVIMDESNPSLSKLNYCQIMFLMVPGYSQVIKEKLFFDRFFVLIMKLIAANKIQFVKFTGHYEEWFALFEQLERPLYKQKFFIYVTNKISENCQTQYFNVVGYLLENTPRQAVIGQFKKILRLILICLEKCAEPEVLHLIIQRITDFVSSGESVIENNFEDIFLRVLNLTAFNVSMVVRIAAIKCVQQFTVSYSIYKLLPYKQKVIQQLGICVDDRKRLVRQDAMACRSLWYLLDAPE